MINVGMGGTESVVPSPCLTLQFW